MHELLLLCISTPALAATTSLASGHVGATETLRLALVFFSWLLLSAAIAWSLRKLTAPAAAALAMSITTLLMASPVAAIPLVRAAAKWGGAGQVSPWQGRIIESIRHTNPFLALLDAVRPELKIDWSHLPGMYQWSGLGQDIPMFLPNAWISIAAYAAAAALFMVFRSAFHRAKPQKNNLR